MRRRSRSLVIVLLGAISCLILAGCVNLPTSGAVREVNRLPNANAPADEGVQLTPVQPGAQWLPKQIVSGFLAATGAAWTGKPRSLSVARKYLTGYYAEKWRPSVAATVIDTNPKVTEMQISSHVTGGQAATQVTVTSQHLETLVSANATEAGSIKTAIPAKPYQFTFAMTQVNGEWRIKGISDASGRANDTLLLLTDSDFVRDYQPRNLYFPAVTAPNTLVPYPVYIPDQAGLLGLQQLVSGLESLPPPSADWLYRSVTTAFPAGSDSKNVQVQVHGNQAVVTLTGQAAKLSPRELAQLKAQLVWTLTYSPYASTGIGSVELQVNGRTWPNQLLSHYAGWVPAGARGPLYVQLPGPGGSPAIAAVKSITPPKPHGKPQFADQTLPAGLGTGPFSTIAISPPSSNQHFNITTFAGCRGKTVYVAPLVGESNLIPPQSLAAACTSLSWDSRGNLWIAAGSDIFVANETPQGLELHLETFYPPPANATYTSLRVAPDGVRVALIVHEKGSTKVDVAAVSKKSKNKYLRYLAQTGQLLTVGPDLTDPIALCWWDADHLLVLDKHDNRAQLYEVPLNGGKSTEVATPDGAESIASNGSIIAVGTVGPTGQFSVKVARSIGGEWHRLAGASLPVYPG